MKSPPLRRKIFLNFHHRRTFWESQQVDFDRATWTADESECKRSIQKMVKSEVANFTTKTKVRSFNFPEIVNLWQPSYNDVGDEISTKSEVVDNFHILVTVSSDFGGQHCPSPVLVFFFLPDVWLPRFFLSNRIRTKQLSGLSLTLSADVCSCRWIWNSKSKLRYLFLHYGVFITLKISDFIGRKTFDICLKKKSSIRITKRIAKYFHILPIK